MSENDLDTDIQLELLEILSDELIKQLLPKKNAPFALIIGGPTDMAKYQHTLCIRYVDEKLKVQE